MVYVAHVIGCRICDVGCRLHTEIRHRIPLSINGILTIKTVLQVALLLPFFAAEKVFLLLFL
jgi:hypothetical protein